MQVYIGADHGRFTLKSKLIPWMTDLGYTVVDCGNTRLEMTDDYPDFAFAVAQRVVASPGSRGIVLCRSAGGVTIAANKVKGARCVTGMTPAEILHNRIKDDANVLAIAGDYTNENEAKELVKTFLTTAFGNADRFTRRLDKIRAREDAWSK